MTEPLSPQERALCVAFASRFHWSGSIKRLWEAYQALERDLAEAQSALVALADAIRHVEDEAQAGFVEWQLIQNTTIDKARKDRRKAREGGEESKE